MAAESKYFLCQPAAGDFLLQGKKTMDFPVLDGIRRECAHGIVSATAVFFMKVLPEFNGNTAPVGTVRHYYRRFLQIC
jgi:hypothetical protein